MEMELTASLGVAVEVTDDVARATIETSVEDGGIREGHAFAQRLLEALVARGMRQTGHIQVCGVGEGVLVEIPIEPSAAGSSAAASST